MTHRKLYAMAFTTQRPHSLCNMRGAICGVTGVFVALLVLFSFLYIRSQIFPEVLVRNGRPVHDVEISDLSHWNWLISLDHDWCNKGRGMCCPVCGMVHMEQPLLLIGKSSPCGGGGFPILLSEWSFTICLMPYNR